MTAYEMLISDARYYGEDTSRRSVNEVGGCYYLQPGTGNRCSIGRRIPDDCAALDFGGGVHDLFDNFPQLSVFEHASISELSELQFFHDYDRFWNPDQGLTAYGRAEFKRLCKLFRGEEGS